MIKFFNTLFLIFTLTSCASYEKYKQITEELEIPAEIYRADFNLTWEAVLQVMKKFDVAFQNQEAGKLKTRWMDNTLQVNFNDSFGSNDAVKSAEFKLLVNVAEGFSYGKKVTKVTIYKRQRVERDFLQGWKEVPTDGIQEKTLLYRIGVIIQNQNKLRAIDKAREQEQLNNF